MREADIEDMSVQIVGKTLKDLRHADDTALLGDSITNMGRILYRVNGIGTKAGLKLNAKKTHALCNLECRS